MAPPTSSSTHSSNPLLYIDSGNAWPCFRSLSIAYAATFIDWLKFALLAYIHIFRPRPASFWFHLQRNVIVPGRLLTPSAAMTTGQVPLVILNSPYPGPMNRSEVIRPLKLSFKSIELSRTKTGLSFIFTFLPSNNTNSSIISLIMYIGSFNWPF